MRRMEVIKREEAMMTNDKDQERHDLLRRFLRNERRSPPQPRGSPAREKSPGSFIPKPSIRRV